jgi:hypothetical protein
MFSKTCHLTILPYVLFGDDFPRGGGGLKVVDTIAKCSVQKLRKRIVSRRPSYGYKEKKKKILWRNFFEKV